MSDYLDPNNEELLKDFFAEAEQQVENLESNILVIENDPTNHEAVDEIFRAAHTLKGGSATVEMTELSGFTHAVEDLLDENYQNIPLRLVGVGFSHLVDLNKINDIISKQNKEK